jgi:Protein of unknown function (DUF4038)/Putative collagen-binding domain of a collagenase
MMKSFGNSFPLTTYSRYSRRESLAMFLGLGAHMLGGAGQVNAQVPPVPPVFPIRIRPGTRFLEDSAGTPFLMHGESAWSLITQLRFYAAERYLNDRLARGFNTVLVMLLNHSFCTNSPNNIYNTPPFLTPGDFSTPNPAYFSYAARIIQLAADKGFLVLLAPAYLGYLGGSEGWYGEMLANGAAKLRQYGRYIGHRYRNFKNIMWVHGGDFSPPNKDVVTAVAEGIRVFDTRSLNTAHCGHEVSALDWWRGSSWLQVNTSYTYDAVYLDAQRQYLQPEAMPFFLIESAYENEHSTTEQRLRTQAYHALLSGAAGHIFGNNPIWHFDGPGIWPAPVTWQQALYGRGSQSMTHLHDFLTPLQWSRMVPDINNAFLVSGLSTDQDRAVASVADDGSFAVVYLPGIRDITVQLNLLSGPKVNARWYDPSTGTYHAVAGSPFPNTGARVFNPLRLNHWGFSDWVLLLQSQT